MKNIIKTTSSFEYPLFKEAQTSNNPTQTHFFTKNSLLTQLAPSNRRSPLIDKLIYLVKKILQFFKPLEPSRLESRMVRLVQQKSGPDALSGPEIFSHYNKWIQKDKTLESKVKIFEQFEKHESKLYQLSKEKPEQKKEALLKKFKDELKNDLEQLKEGESRLLAFNHDSRGADWHSDFFGILTKTDGKWTLTLTGSGSIMKGLSESFLIGDKEKIQRELRFTNLSSDELLNEEWLTAWTQPKDNWLESLKNELKKIETHAVKNSSFEALITKTDNFSKIYWNILHALPIKKDEEELQTLGSEVKQIRLRTHLAQLFELFRRHRFQLRPDTKEYRHLKLIFENVSREVLTAASKGNISSEDLATLNKELQIIENALLRAKCKTKKTFSSKAPQEKMTFLGVTATDFKAKPIPANLKIPAVKIHQEEVRIPAPLKAMRFKIDAPLSIQPARNIKTKEEAFQKLQELQNKWEKATQKTDTHREILRFFREVPQQLFIKLEGGKNEKTDSFWWAFSQEERKKILSWIDGWLDSITNNKILQNEANQAAYEALAKISLLTYAWEVDNGGYKFVEHVLFTEALYSQNVFEDSDYSIFGKFHRAFAQLNSLNVVTFRELVKDKAIMQYYYLDKNIPYVRNRDEKKIREQLYPHTLNFIDKYFPRLFANQDFKIIINDSPSKNILRIKRKSIGDPYLNALLQLARTGIRWDGINKKEKAEQSGAAHEAFQNEPEAVFNHFFDKLNEEILALQKEGFDEALLNEIPHSFTPEEEKRLLHILRLKVPQPELMAFLEECPQLMRNPDVRNFFQTLFFGHEMINFFTDNKFEFAAKAIPGQLEALIKKEKAKIEKALQEAPDDQLLIKGRFEYLAFLIETHTKLKGIYKNPELPKAGENYGNNELNLSEIHFQNFNEELKQMLELCDNHSFLKSQKGYLAQIILQDYFKDGTIQPEVADDLFPLFNLAFNTDMPSYHQDPLVENDLRCAWSSLLTQLDGDSEEFSAKNMKVFLDHICMSKKLHLDTSDWEKKDNWIYQNATFEIDLRTLSISLKETQGNIEFIPHKILADKNFQRLFPEVGDKPFPIQQEQEGEITRYFFKMADGSSTFVEETKDNLQFYRQTKEGNWLQYVSPELLSSKGMEKLLEGKKGLGLIFGMLSFINKKTFEQLPEWLAGGMFIDPKNPLKGMVLNEKGQTLFNLQFAVNKTGLKLEKVQDLRQADNNTYQLNLGNDLSSSELQALQGLEQPENILLWSQKGRVKRVELRRYGLTFDVEGNRLVCNDPKLKGYYVVLNPSLQDKKQLECALVLDHPDSKKPRKLLLPQSQFIQSDIEIVKPKVQGFAKIIYLFQQIYQLIQLMRGKVTHMVHETNLKVSTTENKLSYTALDLRPFTSEIVIGPETPVDTILELAKHYLIAKKPDEALQLLERYPLESIKIDKRTLNKLLSFMHHNLSETKGSASVKLKLALRLKAYLKKNHTEKKLINAMNQYILGLGEMAFADGGKLPQGVSLNKAEWIEVTKLTKKRGAEQFKAQLNSLVAKKDTEWQLDSTFPEQDEALDAAIQSWKAARPTRNMDVAIKELEDQLKPETLLTDADMQYGFKRLDKEVYRLFQPHEVASLFREEDIALPTVRLKSNNPNLEECEKYTLENMQAELEDYVKTEGSKKVPVISASSGKLKTFLQKQIIPKKAASESNLQQLYLKLEKNIRLSKDPEEQLKIYSGQIPIASFDEIKLHFAKGNLQLLKYQGRLPKHLNIKALENNLTEYFEALVKRNALEAAENLIQDALTPAFRNDPEQWKILSKALHHLLTLRCVFDAEKDPRFLIFEAQQFLQFKSLDAGLDQLELLEKILSDPRAIIQAPTGSGKTAIFSVLRALTKPNGKNLVIQKVLPQLLQQTYDKYREVIGDLFGTSIYMLHFNLKMRLTEFEYEKKLDKNQQLVEVKQEVSIFTRMYHDLLKTIETKGCVLTDYKSLPLLEERFWKLGQDMLEATEQGQQISELQREHFTYLRKILILLEKKGDESDDEIDQPSRPIHKIQLDLGVGSHPVPPKLIEGILEIYDLLLADEKLKLTKNVTADFTEAMRLESIHGAARIMADRLAKDNIQLALKLQEYFLGKNEDVLALIDQRESEFKDKIALCKDQFSIFLPITLRGKEGSNYARSDDGLRTLPCQMGEKHDAKRGTLHEQINYTIQDYYQAGIKSVDLKAWLKLLKEKGEKDEARATAQLKAVFPDKTLRDLKDLLASQEKIDELVKVVNAKPALIKPFLESRLSTIKTSGAVVSMDHPQIVDMSAAVSGISATLGAAPSLHPQFHVDEKTNGKIRAQMTYRIAGRAMQEAPVLHYDPENPNLMLQKTKTPMQAVIDGAGAFHTGKEGAESLMASNKNLEQVGYHQEEKIAFVGKATSEKDKSGFFFNQSHTRGTDIPLSKDAKALLTRGDVGLRGYFQEEGRLRLPGQKYQLAISNYHSHIKTIDDAITHAALQDSRSDAQDIYRACSQYLRSILRKAVRKELLKEENVDNFIELFKQKERRDLFIIEAQPNYSQPGDYFRHHKNLRSTTQKPEKALTDYKKDLSDKAEKLGLNEAKKAIEAFELNDELLRQMPANVTPIGRPGEETELELQVEQEEEIEAEEELEVSVELEVEKSQVGEKTPLGTYPARLKNIIDHSIQEKIHPAYDETLYVSDAFLPLSRATTASLHKRAAFDNSMYRVGTVYVKVDYDGKKILGVYLEDPLGVVEMDYHISTLRKKDHLMKKLLTHDDLDDLDLGKGFWWDIRTQKCIGINGVADQVYSEKLITSKKFVNLIAQIKFFDGQIDNYSEEELKALSIWLQKNNPTEMRDHLNQILQYRYQDRIDFVDSQLGKLFNTLC